MDDRHALTVGTMLRQYRIEKVIGQGGFGITYLALDTDLNRHVAIKECYPKDFVERDGTTVVATTAHDAVNFDWALGKFVDEATTLARFKHSGIVQVLQILKDENCSAYMVLEFVEGYSLTEWLKNREQALDEDELKAVIRPLLEALEVVHENGIAHRDIAPDNIYIRDNGEAVLLDFGTAKQTVGHHTRTMNLVVKDGFSAPEQYYSEGRQGPWTDIYAFAATLYRAIAGKRPPDAMARQDALNNDEEDPLEQLNALSIKGFSKDFLNAVMLGLTLQAKRRPQSLREWRAHLLGTDLSLADDQTKKVSANEAPQKTLIPPFAKGVAALLLLGVVGGTGYWFSQFRTVTSSGDQIAGVRPVKENSSLKNENEISHGIRRPTETRENTPDVAISPKTKQNPTGSDRALKRKQAALERKRALAERQRQESQDWQLAQSKDTLLAYQEFANNYPSSGHLRKATLLVADLEMPWSRTFSSGTSETANSVAFNKESIAVGGSVETAQGNRKALIYLLSHSGKLRWRSVLPHNGEHEITDVLLTANGDLVVVGSNKVADFSKPKALLLRFDGQGNLKWSYSLEASSFSKLHSVLELPNGGLVAVGALSKPGSDDKDGWFLHIDGEGQRLHQSTFGGVGADEFRDVALLPDNQLAIAGRTQGRTTDNDDFWMMKLSKAGKASWEKRYGGRMADAYNAVAVAHKGGFFVAGSTESYGSQSIDGNIGYVDQNNYMHPKPVIDKRGDDVLSAAAASKDGGVVVAGYTSSKGAGQLDGWISKYDSSLRQPDWEKVLGGEREDRISAIDILNDGSIVAVGSRATGGDGQTGTWVIKLGPNGDYRAH